MNGLGVRLHDFYTQVSTIAVGDIGYVCDVWSGEIHQGNTQEINTRNAQLTLIFIRAITGTYITCLTFTTLKTLVRLPCMSAFCFLNDVLPLFLNIVISYNLFKTSLNLSRNGNLSNGIIARYLQNGEGPEQEGVEVVQSNGEVNISPYVAGTLFPAIWHSALLYALSMGAQGQAE